MADSRDEVHQASHVDSRQQQQHGQQQQQQQFEETSSGVCRPGMGMAGVKLY